MKTIALASVFLMLGIALGIWTSSRAFLGETLPTKAYLAYFDQLQTPVERSDGPRLVVEGGETYDFGSLPLWAERKHTFVVRNMGNEPLKLRMGKPTCSCISDKELKEGDILEVAPGEERNIVLNWKIRSSNPQFAQSAPFTTNDPHRRSLVLSIVGRVEEAIQKSREIVTFFNVPASISVIESIRLDTNLTDQLIVTSHRFLNHDIGGFFEAEFGPPTPEEASEATGRSTVMARVTLQPGLKVGPFEQTLEVTTNLAPEIPPIQIPIRGTIVGDILVFGPGMRSGSRLVNLGVIPYGSGTKHTVTVTVKGPHRHDTSLSVKDVVPNYLKVAVEQPIDRPNVRQFPVTIEVPSDAPLDNLGGGGTGGRTARIVLETTHPTTKQIELTVHYVVSEFE